MDQSNPEKSPKRSWVERSCQIPNLWKTFCKWKTQQNSRKRWFHSNFVRFSTTWLFSTKFKEEEKVKRSIKRSVPCRLNRLFCLLWSDFSLLWPKIKTLKTHARSLGFWLQRDIEWIFKWAFMFQLPSSSGFKTMDAQSWRSQIRWDILGSRLLRSRL